MKTIAKILRDWFTNPSNTHYEMGRALWFAGAVAMIGFTGWHVKLNGEFNVVDFGMAFSALLAAGGFGIATKDRGAHAVTRGDPA